MSEGHRTILNRLTAPFMEMFGLSRALAFSTVLLISAVLVFAFFWFFHSAPPNQITIAALPGAASKPTP
jgi:hypothetical protein